VHDYADEAMSGALEASLAECLSADDGGLELASSRSSSRLCGENPFCHEISVSITTASQCAYGGDVAELASQVLLSFSLNLDGEQAGLLFASVYDRFATAEDAAACLGVAVETARVLMCMHMRTCIIRCA